MIDIIMEPHLAVHDKAMFYRYMDKSKVYFEYGSGGSTYQASIRPTIYKIYSVESDKEWYNKIQQHITSNITYFYNEMNVRPNTWGYPGPNSTPIQRKKYSNYIRTLTETEQKSIDLILIDGRFRVACCLTCVDIIHPECFIAFDDFLNRPYYHIVLDYYDIVEKTVDNRMVILQRKKEIKYVPEKLLRKYEVIAA